MTQVAVVEVPVVPTFKGFRKQVTAETDGSAKTASQGFSRIFAKTGTDTGKTVGAGFKKAFDQSAQGTSDKVTKALEANVAKASRALSAARLKDQDAVGKVRVAESQLAEARKKYARDSSQVIRAEERLATASRQLGQAHESTERATDDLKRAQGDLARAADRAGDELSESGRKGVSGFRDNVTGGVKGFAGPLIAAFAALGIGNIVADAFREAKDFVLGSIDFASDLSESVNAVEVAYGEAADAVLGLGDASAQTFGLSQKDLNGYATQFSAFVKTIAGAEGDVAGTLETLVGRGTDFASVFNTDVADALGLFQSGLAGETEPLRKYGIDLSAATVEAYALANGIGDGTSALTEAEKVQARYGSLLEQTAAVQGDFANTSEELANQNRINAAEWENIQATVGTAFLPVAKELAGVLADDVLPALAKMAEEQGPEMAQAFSDILPDLSKLVEELLPILPSVIDTVSAALPGMISGLQMVTPLLIWLAKYTSDASAIVSGFYQILSGDLSVDQFGLNLLELAGPIGDVSRWVGDMAFNVAKAMGEFGLSIVNGVDEAVANVVGMPQRMIDGMVDLSLWLYDSGVALMDGFLQGIQDMFGPIGDAVAGALDWVTGFFPHSPAKRGPLSGSGWTDIKKSGAAYWDQFVGGMGDEGPEFPDPPQFPGGSGTSGPAGTSTVGSGRGGVTQINNYAHEDPQVAAALARDQMDSLLRSA